MSNAEQFDAIVVGSGITGGWAAKELTEKGLKVLLLERGRAIQHGKDYIGEHMPPWKIPYGGKPLRKLYQEEYPIQSQSYAFDETNDCIRSFHKNQDKILSPTHKTFYKKGTDWMGPVEYICKQGHLPTYWEGRHETQNIH